MFARLRHWAALAAIVTSHSAFAGVGVSGPTVRPLVDLPYLPAVGPVELRFRDPILPVTNRSQMTLPEPVAVKTNEPPPVQIAATTNTAPPAPVIPPPDTNPPVPPPIPVSTEAPADPMVGAQQLLKYFPRATNAPATGTIDPLQFAPPSSTAPPPSTATYSVTPPPR
jgi:2-oxoglutarate dehydrogenase E2 component (dihydrolipoamide succinyltransferase)